MASLDTDAATEALIAQMMAEDFGEAYANQLRPIGSYYGDYEDPLSSYERHHLENPDMEEEDEDWTPATPHVDPAEDSSMTLPEGATWDSSVNEDPRIEPRPITNGSNQTKPVENWDGEDDERMNEDGDEDGDINNEESTHHLHDPIHYHDQDSQTIQSPRHFSQPNHEPRSPEAVTRRNITDPPQLETTVHENDNHPSRWTWSQAPSPTPPEPISPPVITTRPPKSPKLSNHFAPRRSIATNERLLDLHQYPNLDLDPDLDLSLDTSALKNKGKAPSAGPDNPPHPYPHHHRRNNLPQKRRRDAISSAIDTSADKNKGKTPRTGTTYPPSYLDDNSGSGFDIDDETGLPLLRIPWMGRDESPGERVFREVLEARVVDVRVGREETLDEILKGIGARKGMCF